MIKFGSADQPLHASQIPQLMRCELSVALTILDERSASGKAADTGTAVHMAARAFHREAEGDVSVSVAVMRGAKALYPLADLADAETQFRRYAADPRNKDAKVVLCEQKIKVEIEPAKDDPTQEKIVIVGTLDQVREENANLVCYDIKTGGMYEGPEMINDHLFQLVVYQVGATNHLGKIVRGAGVIRTKDYLKPRGPGPVFWPMPWYYRDCAGYLALVAKRVARTRRGDHEMSPSGGHCRWCPLGGVANCGPRLQELK